MSHTPITASERAMKAARSRAQEIISCYRMCSLEIPTKDHDEVSFLLGNLREAIANEIRIITEDRDKYMAIALKLNQPSSHHRERAEEMLKKARDAGAGESVVYVIGREAILNALASALCTQGGNPPEGFIRTSDGVERKVLGTLVMTEDGCVVGHGGIVYFVELCGNMTVRRITHDDSPEEYSWTQTPLITWGGPQHDAQPLADCSSTRESAEAAHVRWLSTRQAAESSSTLRGGKQDGKEEETGR